MLKSRCWRHTKGEKRWAKLLASGKHHLYGSLGRVVCLWQRGTAPRSHPTSNRAQGCSPDGCGSAHGTQWGWHSIPGAHSCWLVRQCPSSCFLCLPVLSPAPSFGTMSFILARPIAAAGARDLTSPSLMKVDTGTNASSIQ